MEIPHETLKQSPKTSGNERVLCRDFDKVSEAAEEKANYSGSAQVSGRISEGVGKEMKLSWTSR